METLTPNAKIEELMSDPANPENIAHGYLVLGCESEKKSNWVEAVENYSHALALRPSDPSVLYFCHNNLGYSLLQLSRHAEAAIHCQVAITVDGKRHNAHKNLALAQQGLGNHAEAAVDFVNAIFAYPPDTRSWKHLEDLLAHHPELLDDSEDLIKDVEEIRELYKAHGLATTH